MGILGSAASGVGALGGALSGKGAAGGQPFQSAGGVTPEQQALANYSYDQNLLKDATEFQGEGPGGGTGISTMATNAAAGSGMQKALDLGQYSDTNQAAQYKAYEQAGQYASSNLSALGQLANAATGLTDLAKPAGAAAGTKAAGTVTP